ncbi:MAG TPA: acetamidase/formamidase family protein [Thermoleophilaceae bacterium]
MEVRLDPNRPLREQPERGHNRWSPDLEPIASVEPGEELMLELRDSMDGQVTRGTTNEELLDLEAVSHVLTGPVAVGGAEPGDLLELEILRYTTDSFGWTAVLPGAGFLGDVVDRPFLVRWEIADGVARSDDLPGVAVAASTHAGVIGVAPSAELVAEALRRETVLAEAGHPVRMPDPSTAFPDAARDALRTIPPRENGGNLDVRDLTAGARLFLPVHVPGALLSAGDLHFSQGDGEVSLYAIETSGSVTFRVGLGKSPEWQPRFPAYEAPPRPPRAVFATTGMPLDDDGENRWSDLNLATRRALLELIDWLRGEHDLRFEQAYALASVACELRISQAVDVPNVLVSAALPLDVFEAG